MATEYDDQTRGAVLAALLAGQSVSSIAAEYKIPRSTIYGWRDKSDEIAAVATTATEKSGELVANIGASILEYMQTSLRSLIIQATHFGDVDWLRKQSAENLAVLHGVQTDKVMKLLEAINRNAESDN